MAGFVTIDESLIHGLGVFALRDFVPGDVILRIDDTRRVTAQHPLLTGEFEHHCDYLEAGRVVLMQPPERHINSSCDPSAYIKTVEGVRYVVARKQVVQGDEVTCDYIIDCHGGDVWQCRCGSPRCRGTIVSSFFELPIEWQREYLPLLNPWFLAEHAEEVVCLEISNHPRRTNGCIFQ